MIFLAIIALVLGFCLVAFGFIVESMAGPWVAGAVVALFALMAGPRMVRGNQSLPALIVAGVMALLPVWLVPLLSQGERTFLSFLPALLAVTVALILGIYIGRRFGPKYARRPDSK